MVSIRRSFILLVAALAVALVAVYVRDMNEAYGRISNVSSVVSSPYGDIEYKMGGYGPPVLIVHGSGGGFDQGELIASAILGERFTWIAPSRFGYLRSQMPAHADWTDQARAYVSLLDSLGIQRVAVVALSHGGPSALAFAMNFPERVASVSLISCGVTTIRSQTQSKADQQGRLLTRIYQYDFAYWAVSNGIRKKFLTIMGATDTDIAALEAPQKELIRNIIDYMNPVSPRAGGVRFDNETPLLGSEISAISAPTLIVHAMDDTLQLFNNAEFANREIRNSRLISFVKGGHLLLAVEQVKIRELVSQFIAKNSSDNSLILN